MQGFKIDESGYTGFNLLDAEQPFQGAAAIAISDNEAERLIEKHFLNLQATELKYTTLARRQVNHRPLLGLINDILTHHKFVTYVCD